MGSPWILRARPQAGTKKVSTRERDLCHSGELATDKLISSSLVHDPTGTGAQDNGSFCRVQSWGWGVVVMVVLLL